MNRPDPRSPPDEEAGHQLDDGHQNEDQPDNSVRGFKERLSMLLRGKESKNECSDHKETEPRTSHLMVPEDLVKADSPDTAFLYSTGEDHKDHENQTDDAGHRMSDPPRFRPEGKCDASCCDEKSGQYKNVRQV
jgi:hypothetical protein